MVNYPPCKEMPLYFNGRKQRECEQPGDACEECEKLYLERKKGD